MDRLHNRISHLAIVVCGRQLGGVVVVGARQTVGLEMLRFGGAASSSPLCVIQAPRHSSKQHL